MASKKIKRNRRYEPTLENEIKIRPRWKSVLMKIYDDDSTSRFLGLETPITDDHPLAKKLKISGQELKHSLRFLENHNLIVRGSSKRRPTTLTKMGLNIASRLQGQRSTFQYRKSNQLLSGVLAATASLALVYQMNLLPPEILLVIYFAAIAGVFAYVRRL